MLLKNLFIKNIFLIMIRLKRGLFLVVSKKFGRHVPISYRSVASNPTFSSTSFRTNDERATELLDVFRTRRFQSQPSKEYINLLAFAPYLCSFPQYSDHFVNIIDEWWNEILRISGNGRHLANIFAKPTSTIFHLGRFNNLYDGIVIKRLGLSPIERFLKLASNVDLRNLRENDDVLSYLEGIRNLIIDPKTQRVNHPSLKPRERAFFRNLELYLTAKLESAEKLSEIDEKVLFTTKIEAPRILMLLRQIEIDLEILRRNSDRILNLLCKLCKLGFDHIILHGVQTTEDEKCGGKVKFTNYAAAFIYWNLDPDSFVQDSWFSYFKIYEMFPPLDDTEPAMIILRELLYLNNLPQIGARFKKMDLFRNQFERWINDVAQNFQRLCRTKFDDSDIGFIYSDYVSCLSDMLFSLGEFARDESFFKDSNVVTQLRTWFPVMANAFLDGTNPILVNDIQLSRYLTGLRDIRSVLLSDNGQPGYSARFNEKLTSYLIDHLERKLEIKKNKDGSNDENNDAYQISSTMLLLCRLELRLNLKLWIILLKLFEIRFVDKSWRLFENDGRKLCLTLAYFGDACFFFRNQSNEFLVDDRIWKEYFFILNRILKEFELDINHTGKSKVSESYKIKDSDEKLSPENGKPNLPQYRYLLGTILAVTRRFEMIDEFENLKWIWQRRMKEIAPSLDFRTSYLTVKKMGALTKFHRMRFDADLLRLLRSRGMECSKNMKLPR